MAKNANSDTRSFRPSPPRAHHAEPLFRFRVGDAARDFTYSEAFALGHSLLRAKKFQPAASIFKKLTEVPDRGPRAHIMLAICRAGLSNYQESRSILDGVFQEGDRPLAGAIQDVIVQSRMGFKDGAVKDLVELVNTHQELPTLSLWLGDMLAEGNKTAKAMECWKLAINRDRQEGSVALAARSQLQRSKG